MRDEEQSKVYGVRAENYFASLLNRFGIQFEFVNDWFDFLVNKEHKVEVKSCQVSIKEGRKEETHFRCGRFDFTREENREKQFNENIWVAFVLRHDKDFMFLGFVRAQKLNKKRYVPISELRKLNLLTFENWLIETNNRKK